MNINISSYNDFIKIDNEFLHYLQINDDTNYQYLLNKRLTKQKMNSENIIKIGIHLDNFLTEIFNLQIWQRQNIQNTEFEKKISHYKRVFFQRFILQKYNKNWYKTLHENHTKFLQQNINENIDIENIDIEIINYLTLLNHKNNYENINDEKFIIYCESLAIIYYKNLCHNSSLLKGVIKIDSENLDKTNINQSNRNSFEWTNIITQKDVLYNANYCLYCHERGRDSCKKGLHKNNEILVNPLGNELHGCPIDEDTSEMIKVYSIGYLIA